MTVFSRTEDKVTIGLCLCVAVCLSLWLVSSDLFARWGGVPPVPTARTAEMGALGDAQFSYRSGAMTLQVLGDTGGEITPLKEYNYARLGDWFGVLSALDPASDHIPMIAAYYFGATRVPQDVKVIVDYLAVVGDSPVGQKWRWLAHAAYLARHRLNDMDRAIELAYRLARITPLDGKPLPVWARQMPAFILNAQGEAQASRRLIEQMLLTDTGMHPNEINFMAAYLYEQLGVSQAEVDQLLRLRATGLSSDSINKVME